MDNPRKPQHRPRREDAKGRELSDLKQENKQLRRQVSRLRRQVEQTDFDLPLEPEARADDGQTPSCPLCGSTDLAKFETPAGSVRIGCRACKKYKAVAPNSL